MKRDKRRVLTPVYEVTTQSDIRKVLFDEIDRLRSGALTPEQARAVAIDARKAIRMSTRAAAGNACERRKSKGILRSSRVRKPCSL